MGCVPERNIGPSVQISIHIFFHYAAICIKLTMNVSVGKFDLKILLKDDRSIMAISTKLITIVSMTYTCRTNSLLNFYYKPELINSS
jgi:hypothetical protein